MMLGYLGRRTDEERIHEAVRQCLLADQVTPELGGTLSTTEVGDAVLSRLR
jgi:isocitrate/isopropylmalate dehydrogenase